MTVNRTSNAIELAGDCTVEDAEILLAFLIEDRGAIVDFSQCGNVHAAVAQVMLAAKVRVRGLPAEPLLAEWVLPQLLDAATKNNFRVKRGRSS